MAKSAKHHPWNFADVREQGSGQESASNLACLICLAAGNCTMGPTPARKQVSVRIAQTWLSMRCAGRVCTFRGLTQKDCAIISMLPHHLFLGEPRALASKHCNAA